MKPLRLHTKTTLVVSVVIVLTFAAIGYVYDTVVERIALDERAARAELFVSQIADRIGRQRLITSTPALETDLGLIKQIHPELSLGEVAIFELQQGTYRSAIRLPEDSSPSFPAEFLRLSAQGSPASKTKMVDTTHASIFVSAPIAGTDTPLGFVAARFETTREKLPLVGTLRKTTLAAVAIALVVVTVTTYLLFRYLIYRPLDRLLVTMTQAQNGNLSVSAAEDAPNEVGQLSRDFNLMLAKIREMSEEREQRTVQLQKMVGEATAILGERNVQLEAANQHLFEMQRQLTQLERLATAGQMAAQFAHEVGTPLNLISGHVQLLQSKTTDERVLARLDVIGAQIDRIARIVRGMLDATSRPSANKRPLDINDVLKKTIEATLPTLESLHVRVVCHLDEDLPAVVTDEDQLQQIFLNLIDNSVDAMPGGGTLTFSTRRKNGSVVIECEDSGQGMSEETKAHMFDPLFTTKERGQGSGLGLAIIRQIVKDHRGEIEVETELAKGTRLRITLPDNGAERE